MTVSIQEIPESVVIRCQGELDQDAVTMFEKAIKKAEILPHHNIWVDCQDITSVSTAAMRSILSHLGTIDALGLNLVLYNLQPAVHKRLEQSGMDSVLTILPGIKEAYLLHKNRG